MIQKLEKRDVFLSSFARLERQSNGKWPSWMHRRRSAAIARFEQQGFPTTRHEEWRFTDVSQLTKVPFEPARPPSDPPTAEALDEATSLAPGSRRIVLVNGHYSHHLSTPKAPADGLICGSLAEALRTREELVEPHLGRHAACQDHAFVALNTAFLDDGAFIYVPPATVVEEPIHVLHVWSPTERPSVAHPRNLIVAQRRAEVKIVETYLGLGDHADFTNVVTEIVLAPGAVVDHYKLQREGRGAFHMGTVQAHQGRESTFFSNFISLGGLLVRNETNTVLGGEGCQCTLNGLYVARGRQHVDSRTRIDHAKPHCHSQELYKGILDDRAKGVFNGKIFVYPDAQKTDAKQVSQVVLLSDAATVNAKPQLEIFADDVRCTHGATVGRLDEEALFYLRSRGVSHQAARDLLTYAFANDVVSRVRLETVRAEVQRILLAVRGLPIDTAIEERP